MQFLFEILGILSLKGKNTKSREKSTISMSYFGKNMENYGFDLGKQEIAIKMPKREAAGQ